MSITAETIEGVAADVDSNARKALLGSAVGYAMDGFDLLILGFMLRTIAGDLKLSPAQSASLVTATLIGAVLGGICCRIASVAFACSPGRSSCSRCSPASALSRKAILIS
jgi:MFS family permease